MARELGEFRQRIDGSAIGGTGGRRDCYRMITALDQIFDDGCGCSGVHAPL